MLRVCWLIFLNVGESVYVLVCGVKCSSCFSSNLQCLSLTGTCCMPLASDPPHIWSRIGCVSVADCKLNHLSNTCVCEHNRGVR